MTPDPEVWYQARAGGAWYQRGIVRQKDPRYIRVCAQCDQGFLGKRNAQFCNRACSNQSRVQRPAEIPDWIDTAIWRPGSQGTWYKSDSKHAYVIKVCARCGANYIGLRQAQFCSVACGNGGDGLSYGWAHDCVRREKGPASGYACVGCGTQAADWSYDGLDPGELIEPDAGKRYSFNPDHYQPRCHRCHAHFDGHVGEGNGNAKLTDAQCREIYLSTGATQQELADRFGVKQAQVSRIRRGRRTGALIKAEDHGALEAEECLRGMSAGG